MTAGAGDVRVCLITENHAGAVMGGAEYQTLLLAEELSRRPGVAVAYLARRVPAGGAAQNLPYTLKQIGNPAGIRRRAVFFDAKDIARALDELQPHVIYQQGKQSYTAMCARYARRAGVPFFFHVAHDFDLNYGWITSHLSPNTPFDIVEYMAGDWGIRRASHIIVQSERQGVQLQKRFGRTASLIVRNFQPLPETLPVKPEGPLQIFWVANLKDFKRPALFVDLAESFAGRSDLEFVMAGRPPGLRRFAPLMERIPKVRNLRYLGELPIERVNELMDAAAVHVNTSSFEGFPNTFLQAWARGAVVASLAVDPDAEGMETLGIGYCSGSMDRLHAIIDELSRAPKTRQTVAERAFAFVHEKHGMAHGARLADHLLNAARDAQRSRQLYVGS
jgi:hypothetical protein